jgi:YVTN family beta-propeller protein
MRVHRLAPLFGVLVVLAAACASSTGTRHGLASRTTTTSTVRSDPAETPTGAGPGVDVYAGTTAGKLSPVVAADPPRVYVPNSVSNTVDVIDPVTYRVVEHFPVGATPQHVVPGHDLKTLYVNDNRGNALTPIDPRTGLPGPPIPVDDPYNLYFTPDGRHALVMAEARNRIDVRDPTTFAPQLSIPVPHAGVNHADFTPNGLVMIASCEFSGYVVRVDLTTMRVTGSLSVGGSPVDVRSSPDGTVMFVANQVRGGVSVVDPAAMREIGFVPTGRGAHGLYPSRDGTRLYVTNRLAGTISTIDFATRRVVATWHTGGSPDMGGVSADGSQFWVSERYGGRVDVIDTRTGAVLHRIPVGVGPHGVAVFPQPGTISLGHTGNYR